MNKYSTISDPRDRVLFFIEQHISVYGYPPTLREIMDGCNLASTSVADYHLNVLQKFGKIERDEGIARGIRIVK